MSVLLTFGNFGIAGALTQAQTLKAAADAALVSAQTANTSAQTANTSAAQMLDTIDRYLFSPASVSAMRAKAGITGSRAQLLGYHAAGDGGGGVFYWNADSTAPDDGFMCIKVAGVATGRWMGILEGNVLNIKRAGAKGDDVTDDWAAIQAVINFASYTISTTPRQITIFCPAGIYRVSQIIDLTSFRADNKIRRDAMVLRGESKFATFFRGATGPGKPVIDTTGNQWLRLESFCISANGVPVQQASTIGIYSGIFQELNQTQNQIISDVLVEMQHNPAANNNIGTVAYYNFGAEENTLNLVQFLADRPMVLTAYAANPYNYPYPKAPLQGAHSLGVTTMSGECFLAALGQIAPAIDTIDINSFQASSLYIAGIVMPGTTPTHFHALRIHGSFLSCRLGGTIEGFAGIADIHGRIANTDMNFTMGNTPDTDKALINLVRGGEGIITASVIRAYITVNARPLFSTFPEVAQEAVSCYLKDSQIYCSSPLNLNMPHEKVLYNLQSDNTQIHSGTGPVYRIDSQKQSLAIIKQFIRGQSGSPASAVVMIVKLPTAISGTSATGITVRIRGVAGHSNFGSNGTTSVSYEGTISIIMSQTGAVTIGTATNTLTGNTANSTGNTLSAIALSGTQVGATVELRLTPTTGGINNEAVSFSGTCEMSFMGHSCNAPSLTPSLTATIS